MTALSATVGTGNIAGVATAIALGGPGAIFYMWLIALFGMATKYAEAVCAVTYREKDATGKYVGGPMYYLRNGVGEFAPELGKYLGLAFAIFGAVAAFGTGNAVQVNSMAAALGSSFGVPTWVTGLARISATRFRRRKASPTAVRDYIRRADAAGMNRPLGESLDDAQPGRRPLPVQVSSRVPQPQPQWSEVRRELRGKGVRLALPGQQHKAVHPERLQYSRFCEQYQAWASTLNAVMRQEHRAGEKMNVEYAGQTVAMVDPRTGAMREAQIFIAVSCDGRSRKRSDHRGGVVQHLNELEDALAAPTVQVPSHAPVRVAQIRDHVRHRPVLRRGEPALGRAVAFEARRERGDLIGAQGLAARKRVQDSLPARERELAPPLREPTESGLVRRPRGPGPGDVTRSVGVIRGVRRIGAAVQNAGAPPLPRRRGLECDGRRRLVPRPRIGIRCGCMDRRADRLAQRRREPLRRQWRRQGERRANGSLPVGATCAVAARGRPGHRRLRHRRAGGHAREAGDGRGRRQHPHWS